MANWKFWQRKKQTDNSDLPEEVREYYESTSRSRGPAAFLLGLVTLLVTLALAALLYFAGRFVWQQFFTDKADTPPTTEQTTVEDQAGEGGGQSTDESAPGQSDGDAAQPEDSPATLPGDENEPGSAATDDDSATDGTGATRTPDTGPGDVMAIFIGTTLMASLAYEVLARKKQISSN